MTRSSTHPLFPSTYQSVEAVANGVQHRDYLDSAARAAHLGKTDYVSKEDANVIQIVHHHRSERNSEGKRKIT